MNYYVFTNRYEKVLSDQTWNAKLREYFIKSELVIDKGVKENNLSHRFRHGFAMYCVRFAEKPIDVLALQKLLRHKSIRSTMIYYNPTPEDEYKTKVEFQNEEYKMHPLLRRIDDNEK